MHSWKIKALLVRNRKHWGYGHGADGEAGSEGRVATVRSMAQSIIRAVAKSTAPVSMTRWISARFRAWPRPRLAPKRRARTWGTGSCEGECGSHGDGGSKRVLGRRRHDSGGRRERCDGRDGGSSVNPLRPPQGQSFRIGSSAEECERENAGRCYEGNQIVPKWEECGGMRNNPTFSEGRNMWAKRGVGRREGDSLPPPRVVTTAARSGFAAFVF